MAERWLPVPACRLLGILAGCYEASDDGEVRSVRRTLPSGRRVGGQLLTQWPDKDGYAMVKAGGRPMRVAVLVQLAFAGPPEVRHLDGDRSNDRPENLAWGSRWRNEQDKTEEEEDWNGWDEWERPFPAVSGETGGQR